MDKLISYLNFTNRYIPKVRKKMRMSKIPDQILELLDNLAKYFATKNFWWVQWIPIWECLLKMMYFQNFKDIQIILNHSVSNYSFKGCVPCISAVLREAYVNLQNCVFQLNNQCYRISLEVICFWSPTFNKLFSLRELCPALSRVKNIGIAH